MGEQQRAEIRSALERNNRAVSLRPGIAQGTAVARVTWREGLTCDVEEGPWRMTIGMTPKYGGTDAGPNPGVYGRTALGSCLVIGYAMWAARLDVPFDALSVEIEADYDARGELGLDASVRPGYLAMRYVVTVRSSAPEADILRVLDTADRHSSYLDDFRNPVPVERRVVLNPSTG